MDQMSILGKMSMMFMIPVSGTCWYPEKPRPQSIKEEGPKEDDSVMASSDLEDEENHQLKGIQLERVA